MVTPLIKHVTTGDGSPFKVIACRAMGAVGGRVKPSKTYSEMKYVYEIDPSNGEAVSTHSSVFPSGKYDALDFTPTWNGRRFVGWFREPATPSSSIPVMDGELTSATSVVYSVKTVYAHWQLPVNVAFDASSNWGEMPEGWVAPNYYAGQPYGQLPTPTHGTLNFTGWYVNGIKVSASSIVPDGGATLVAQYRAQSYSVDLNNEWRHEEAKNPDLALYDGVYQSFANTNDSSGNQTMAKMYIDVIGFTSFKILIGSSSESFYDYVVAMEPDVDPVFVPWFTYNDTSAGVKDSNYDQTYTNPYDPLYYKGIVYQLDGGHHRICIVYRKDSGVSNGDDCGYVLIPKEQ